VSETAIRNQGDAATMDPNKILFSTPTLNDAIPATVQGSTATADCIQLHEDDWRQFEFIPTSLKSDVDAELAHISVIWDKQSVPLGDAQTAFREVHVRKRIPQALKIPMSLAEIRSIHWSRNKTNDVLRLWRSLA
jgi:hypothetical protein